MLYLVSCELIGSYPLPPEQWLNIVLEDMKIVQEHKTQGKIIAHGAVVGRQAGYTVYDVASHSELQEILTALPVWPFMEWEVIPLIPTEEVIESVDAMCARMADAEKK